MNNDINFYCRVYENVFEPEWCDELIRHYEWAIERKADEIQQKSLCYKPDGTKICTACDCSRVSTTEFSDIFDEYNQTAGKKFSEIVQQYVQDCKISSTMWPRDFGWEELKVKRYRVGTEEQFKHHVDVSSHAQAKRFLVFTAYLNDDFEDGRTVFPVFNNAVVPKKGSVLVFPPLWTYLHYAEKPTGDAFAKYILMSYLNYIDLNEVDYSKNPLAGEATRPGQSSNAGRNLQNG